MRFVLTFLVISLLITTLNGQNSDPKALEIVDKIEEAMGDDGEIVESRPGRFK